MFLPPPPAPPPQRKKNKLKYTYNLKLKKRLYSTKGIYTESIKRLEKKLFFITDVSFHHSVLTGKFVKCTNIVYNIIPKKKEWDHESAENYKKKCFQLKLYSVSPNSL